MSLRSGADRRDQCLSPRRRLSPHRLLLEELHRVRRLLVLGGDGSEELIWASAKVSDHVINQRQFARVVQREELCKLAAQIVGIFGCGACC